MNKYIVIGNVVAQVVHVIAVYQRSQKIATIYFDNLDEIDVDIDENFDLEKIAELLNS